MILVSFLFSFRLYLLLSHILGVSLPPSACSNPLCRHPPLPPRRSPLVLRLFALALADGSGLPFSLYPPPAALESQTPQREARALPRRAQIYRGATHFFTFHSYILLAATAALGEPRTALSHPASSSHKKARRKNLRAFVRIMQLL